MKPVNYGGHAAYQARLVTLLKKYYPDAFCRFGPSLWNTIEKFYSMDLSHVDILMYDRYSVFGPRPRLPSDMLRSIMLSLVLKKTSFTAWSEELKTNPIAAIISGFHPDDTPGVGTFYDFCDRLWLSQKGREAYEKEEMAGTLPFGNDGAVHDSLRRCAEYCGGRGRRGGRYDAGKDRYDKMAVQRR